MTHWIGRLLGVFSCSVFTLGAISAIAEEGKSSAQVLALVSVDKPIELLCHEGKCFVELSAFCLQPDYKTPKRGTRYQVAGVNGIRATGYQNDGTPVTLDSARHFDLSALRTHVAVEMAIRPEIMRELDLTRVEVSVAPNVSLVAVDSGKYQSQSETSIATATGPWRKIGAQIVDRDPERMSAARATNRIANSLRPDTHIPRKTTRALWDSLIRDGSFAGMKAEAVQLLSKAYQKCEGDPYIGGMTTMRECVSETHDNFVNQLNIRYWEIIRGAS